MDEALNILYLEDDPDFAEYVRAVLDKEGFRTRMVVVDNIPDLLTGLEKNSFDVILGDYRLPSCTGLQALEAARQKAPDTPFVLISGVIGEETAIEGLRCGAMDYVPKSGINRLIPAMHRAIQAAQDRTHRRQTATHLALREMYFRTLTENSLDVLSILDEDGIFQYNSPSLTQTLGYQPEELVGTKLLDLVHPDDLPGATQAFGQALRSPGLQLTHECRFRRRDGSWCYLEVICRNRFDDPGVARLVLNSRDVTGRRRGEDQLKQAQGELAHASRLAGMAEVATSVLHNVGNVLNSINISATIVADELKKSKIAYIARVAAMMREHEADIGEFMTHDSKGKQLPEYLSQLAESLVREQSSLLKEMEEVRKNLDHIKDIVTIQQSYSKISGVSETARATDLVEDALRMNTGALMRHAVKLAREFEPQIPEITVQKHKVLQILVNLIRNAKYACDESNQPDKCITLRVGTAGGCVRIAVIDNGVGIPSENLAKLFNHGFTTRKEGHGFGLHSSLRAAKEMGGTLLAHSDGPGKGATFTLELPVQSPPQ
jgi:PAS domain S-box-containing protein